MSVSPVSFTTSEIGKVVDIGTANGNLAVAGSTPKENEHVSYGTRSILSK